MLFELPGFATDNGPEFLNWHWLRHLAERPKAVGFTRSPPGRRMTTDTWRPTECQVTGLPYPATGPRRIA